MYVLYTSVIHILMVTETKCNSLKNAYKTLHYKTYLTLFINIIQMFNDFKLLFLYLLQLSAKTVFALLTNWLYTFHNTLITVTIRLDKYHKT